MEIDKIGQMILLGFRGCSIDEMSPFVRQGISQGKIGGILYFDYDCGTQTFSRNIKSPEQLSKLSKDLQNLSPTPLFIGVDEEGGKVSRLKETYGFSASLSPFIQEKLLKRKQKTYFLKCAEELKSLGINLNFAPCVDKLYKNSYMSHLERCFSSDVHRVTEVANLAIESFSKKKVYTCLKHFPGHGSASNTHIGMSDITQTWQEEEVIPYTQLANLKTMVMIAHVFHKKMDEVFPASLSQKVITNLLREKLGFKGVVVSDDIDMKALSCHYSLEERVVRFIEAGGDIVLAGNNLSYDENLGQKIYDIISKNISKERIEESFERIYSLKKIFLAK
ncbi:MAG: glycoside hydrolase family 3 N-terminal domain-containing protein [Alphaproteobacteria bacterium]|nr:glycoside hydrolase family 3 N-terminal domain-containing protein [Alphaproteobacteria bacterium]